MRAWCACVRAVRVYVRRCVYACVHVRTRIYICTHVYVKCTKMSKVEPHTHTHTLSRVVMPTVFLLLPFSVSLSHTLSLSLSRSHHRLHAPVHARVLAQNDEVALRITCTLMVKCLSLSTPPPLPPHPYRGTTRCSCAEINMFAHGEVCLSLHPPFSPSTHIYRHIKCICAENSMYSHGGYAHSVSPPASE